MSAQTVYRLEWAGHGASLSLSLSLPLYAQKLLQTHKLGTNNARLTAHESRWGEQGGVRFQAQVCCEIGIAGSPRGLETPSHARVQDRDRDAGRLHAVTRRLWDRRNTRSGHFAHCAQAFTLWLSLARRCRGFRICFCGARCSPFRHRARGDTEENRKRESQGRMEDVTPCGGTRHLRIFPLLQILPGMGEAQVSRCL